MPARGGSQSIKRKNLVPVAGRPLLDYGVRAAQASGCLERIVCSTDDEEIASRARDLGIEVSRRPDDLATDDAKVDQVAARFLSGIPTGERPDAVILVQPTSPFLLPGHVRDMVDAFARIPGAASIHNVAPVVHNLHAWNQRSLSADGRVNFLFAQERQKARNKQEKPALCAFGNLIGARSQPLLEGRGFYAEAVYALEIERRWAFDLDSPEDLAMAEAILASGLVSLPHF